MNNQIVTWHSDSSSFEAFQEGLLAILSQQPQSIIILSCSANHYIEKDINPLLQNIDISICGGIYANVFIGKQLLEQGVLFVGLASKVTKHQFQIDNDDSIDICQLIENNIALKKESSCLMFYDGLMLNTECFLDELYSTLDREMTIAGGGAGHLDFVQRPCIYTNEGLKSNIIQLITPGTPLSAGIGHGWTVLAGPFLVTESEGPMIKSLNYQDAYSLYKETVENLSDHKFDECKFFDISRHFPFGIENITGEILVRDPILHIHTSIQCVGNVANSTMVYILKGEKNSLLTSATNALESAHSEAFTFTIVFDCISRKFYLEDDFAQELELLLKHNSGKPIFGVLSLGEVANDQGGAMKLLNKSIVIGCL